MNRLHVPYWLPEWVHPGPLFRSSKMDSRLKQALDDMDTPNPDFYKTIKVDESLLPHAGIRTIRPRNYLLVMGQ